MQKALCNYLVELYLVVAFHPLVGALPCLPEEVQVISIKQSYPHLVSDSWVYL